MMASAIQSVGTVIMVIIAAAVVVGAIYYAIVQTILRPVFIFVFELIRGPWQRDGGYERIVNGIIGVVLIGVGEAISQVVTAIGIALVVLMVLLTLRFRFLV